MTRTDILRRFQAFSVWERRGERAPHKPLLILYAIGKLLLGKERLPYKEIEEDLRNLLKEFGPWRRNYRPQDPFWRLKNARNPEDRIWEIPNEHEISEGRRSDGTPTGDAIIADLQKHGLGGFLEPIADQLRSDVGLRFEVVGRLLGSHFPVTYHADILQAGSVGFDPTALLYFSSNTGDYLSNGAFFAASEVEKNYVTPVSADMRGSNGEGRLASIMFQVIDVNPSVLTLSPVTLVDPDGERFHPCVVNGRVVVNSTDIQPVYRAEDINEDGVVNIQDMVLVNINFGKTGENKADVNG